MKRYLSEAAIVVAFNQDNFVKLKQAKAADAFKKITAVPPVDTGQPDTADPSIPRIVFKDKFKGIAVSQNSAQLAIVFEKKEDINEQVQTVLENIDMLFNATKEFEGESNIKDTGLLVSVVIPSEKPFRDLNDYLFKHYTAFEPMGEVANLFYRIGFKTENNLFLGLDLGAFEQNGDKENRSSGYAVRVNLNNKPMFDGHDNNVLVNINGIKEKFQTIINTGLDKFLKNGLI